MTLKRPKGTGSALAHVSWRTWSENFAERAKHPPSPAR